MAAVTILIIDKTQKITEKVVKDFQVSQLYKKAGYKQSDGFITHVVWKWNHYNVVVYGKTSGKAGQENKYDFPPPIDNTLFFNSCVIVNYKKIDDSGTPRDSDAISLTIAEWDTIYEALFGGFEDIAESDISSEEDLPSNAELDSNGYELDGFVVPDDVELDEEAEDEEEEEEEKEEKENKKKSKRIKKKSEDNITKTKTKTKAVKSTSRPVAKKPKNAKMAISAEIVEQLADKIINNITKAMNGDKSKKKGKKTKNITECDNNELELVSEAYN